MNLLKNLRNRHLRQWPIIVSRLYNSNLPKRQRIGDISIDSITAVVVSTFFFFEIKCLFYVLLGGVFKHNISKRFGNTDRYGICVRLQSAAVRKNLHNIPWRTWLVKCRCIFFPPYRQRISSRTQILQRIMMTISDKSDECSVYLPTRIV